MRRNRWLAHSRAVFSALSAAPAPSRFSSRRSPRAAVRSAIRTKAKTRAIQLGCRDNRGNPGNPEPAHREKTSPRRRRLAIARTIEILPASPAHERTVRRIGPDPARHQHDWDAADRKDLGGRRLLGDRRIHDQRLRHGRRAVRERCALFGASRVSTHRTSAEARAVHPIGARRRRVLQVIRDRVRPASFSPATRDRRGHRVCRADIASGSRDERRLAGTRGYGERFSAITELPLHDRSGRSRSRECSPLSVHRLRDGLAALVLPDQQHARRRAALRGCIGLARRPRPASRRKRRGSSHSPPRTTRYAPSSPACSRSTASTPCPVRSRSFPSSPRRWVRR